MATATQASVRVIKNFTYRGATTAWSNRYYLSSTTGPADTAHWNTLFDAIVAAEKACLGSGQTIVECIGYQGGSDLPIASKTYSQAGTMSNPSNPVAPGDCAAMIRYSTTQRTSKNHPVYLYNWYHGAVINAAGGGDTLWTTHATALQTYANAWVAGFSDGTNTYKKSGPRGAVAQSANVSTVIRHRDFLA